MFIFPLPDYYKVRVKGQHNKFLEGNLKYFVLKIGEELALTALTLWFFAAAGASYAAC